MAQEPDEVRHRGLLVAWPSTGTRPISQHLASRFLTVSHAQCGEGWRQKGAVCRRDAESRGSVGLRVGRTTPTRVDGNGSMGR